MKPDRRLRDAPLDALRGIAIIGMVLVNLQGSDDDAFPLLTHAPWNGLTIADLVFPMFLLAVGLSLPLNVDRREPPPGIGRFARRAVLLWLIGFGIGWIVHASVHVKDIRFTGVLERIAICYLIAALVCRASRGWITPLALAAALMLLHGVLFYTPAPGDTAASMLPAQGMSGWLDRVILPGRLYEKTWDPEGPLSTLSAIATALIGVGVQRLAMGRAHQALNEALAALACLLLAVVAVRWWPINKPLWTPTFTLLNAGIGLTLLAMLRFGWPAIGQARIATLLARLGQAALTLYVVHALLTAILVIRISGERLWLLSFQSLARLGLPLDWTSLLYAVIAGAIAIVITLALQRRGWVLRV